MKYLLIVVVIMIGNFAFAQIPNDTLQEFSDEVIVHRDEVDSTRIYDKRVRAYNYVDELPIPSGGWAALMQYIADNLDYDCSKIQDKSLCVVFLFVVEMDGSLSRIKMVRKSGNRKFDRAAIKLKRKMPPWTPGKINGQPVRAKSNFPVSASSVQWYRNKKKTK